MEMNGKKILNRLIVLFMAINVLLLICISLRKETQYKLSQTRINNITALLAEKQITLKEQLPEDFTPRAVATLSYTADHVTVRNDIVKAFFGNNLTDVNRSTENSKAYPGTKMYCFTKGQEQLAFDKENILYTNTSDGDLEGIGSRKEVKAMAETFIKRLGVGKLYKESHIDFKEEGNKLLVTYFPIFEGIPVFDLSIEMAIEGGQIKEAVINLGEVATAGESKQRIIPADLVLFGIEEYIPQESNMMIKEMTLGYKSLDKKGSNLWGKQIVPMYKIEVDGLEKPLFVNAYTNEMVK